MNAVIEVNCFVSNVLDGGIASALLRYVNPTIWDTRSLSTERFDLDDDGLLVISNNKISRTYHHMGSYAL
jgi:hypothetical protein